MIHKNKAEKWGINGDSPTDKTEEEIKANAQLIAAAPDMLEALMIINGDIGRAPNPYTLQEKIEIVEKAINKALGK